jgi:capsular exopolysaccharide synthesis family protein
MAAIEPLPTEDTFRLREYLGVLRRRKYSIAIITIIAVGASLLYVKQATPVFESTANVLAVNTLLNVGTQGQTAPNMDTESQLVTSDAVIKCAWQILQQPAFRTDVSGATVNIGALCSTTNLATVPLTAAEASTPSPTPSASASVSPSPKATGTPSPSLTASPVFLPVTTANAPVALLRHVKVTFTQTATVLLITYSDTLKARAQAGAQAFALAYIEIKTQQASTELANLRHGPQDLQNGLVKQQSDLQKAYDAQLALIASKTAGGIRVDPSDTAKLDNIQAQLNIVNQNLAQVNTQLNDLCTCKITPPQLVLPARLPQSPASPNKPLDAGLGLFVGLAFGIGLAFLRERLDDGLRGRTDLEENLGAPVLAVIPRVPGWRKKQEPKLVTIDQPKSAVSEAYRTLRTSVLFSAIQRGLKTIMVSSAGAGEGKTTTAANLAVVLADANKRVILVSADLRKPRVHRFFNLDNDTGLSSALVGEVKPWEALKDPGVENLRILPSGPVPARPAELLQSEQMGELLMELREVADFVIIDTAPVLLVADALALVPLVDGVLFVADSEATSRSAVSHAREQLEQVDAPLFGCVFNNFDPSKAKSYPYYGAYGAYRYRYRHGYGTYGGVGAGGAYDGEGRRLQQPPPPPAGIDFREERRNP